VSRPPASLQEGISAREAEVLTEVGHHLTNSEIAGKLFISVRTVESHVSSLLRKLQVDDRRALADIATSIREDDATGRTSGGGALAAAARLAAPPTSFVGRAEERAALAQALQTQRLVTAVGPGGVGKTRLALAAIGDVHHWFPDGAWYVDLVPVTDPELVAPAIRTMVGLGEQESRTAEESVLDWLASRQSLLVLDNCEHLLDGVVPLLERLLAGSPGLTVLATSRARLLASFEWVFQVPGLSIRSLDGGRGDAVELFAQRAAAGGTLLSEADLDRVAPICDRLDGVALAVELAAARLPSLGLDGLEAALADRLTILTGAARTADRHRSLRSTLDWSYALLDERERAVLRRVAIFATAFTANAADAVLADWPPVECESIPAALAGLADQSLLVAVPGPTGMRYRAAETIRQYAAQRMVEADESTEAATRHLRWCLDAAADLWPCEDVDGMGRWRARLDGVVDELRAALNWAIAHGDCRVQAHDLAVRLAELSFTRGWPGEAQRRYEQAAALAADDHEAAEALRSAAGAAETRHFGLHALVLLRSAGDAEIRAGNRAAAAHDLVQRAELMKRAPGLISTVLPPGAAEAALAEAWELGADDPRTVARAMVAESFLGNSYEPITAELAERAIVLARRVGDRLCESAALDQLTSVELARGAIREATKTAMRRLEVLAPVPVVASSALEHLDALSMAAECALAEGELATSRALAEDVRSLPFYREEGHLANARLLVVAVMSGEIDHAIKLSEHFREGWVRAGRPRAGNLSRAVYAAATAHGLRGHDDLRHEWLDIVAAISTPGRAVEDTHFGEFFDALLWLHRGDHQRAFGELTTPPEEFREWHSNMWRPWYAGLWAEAAVLADRPDAVAVIDRACKMSRENEIASLIVDRAEALLAGDRDGVTRAAAGLEQAGCHYQWARTMVMLGEPEANRGAEAFAAMGVTPMVWPPGSG
jgi:predicted ATPase/DNA-binding CsgD family transcriptional regulator